MTGELVPITDLVQVEHFFIVWVSQKSKKCSKDLLKKGFPKVIPPSYGGPPPTGESCIITFSPPDVSGTDRHGTNPVKLITEATHSPPCEASMPHARQQLF